MASQPSAIANGPRPKHTLVVLGILGALGLCVVAALVGVLAYPTVSGPNMAGLEGTWRDPANPRHSHRFQPNGDLKSNFGSLPMAQFATWRRDGQQITIRTIRNWDFVGQLEGDEIRGKMLTRDETGAVVHTTDTVWRRAQPE
jgi:hypothetical protein